MVKIKIGEWLVMNLSELVAFLAALISLLAVFIAKRQNDISEKHNRLSVKPRFGINLGHPKIPEQRGLQLYNNGMGLGILRKIFVKLKGKTLNLFFKEDFDEFTQFMTGDEFDM
jgi:hypothetical protein